MSPTILITGARKGIGRYLVDHYLKLGMRVIGCSRSPLEKMPEGYTHYRVDIGREEDVLLMFQKIRKAFGNLDYLINNAAIASMNHALLTPGATASAIFSTNVLGAFFCCREAAKLMRRAKFGRVVNFSTIATPLQLEGEAIYASSKAAVVTLTKILARELAPFGITVNAVGPTPIQTDLIAGVGKKKLELLLQRQAIKRFGEFVDVSNAIDFFLQKRSDFITGQTLYLGGV